MTLTVTLLGTGTSAGVPMIGCTCEVCRSTDPRDKRDRPGAMVRWRDPAGQLRTVLIDTTPDLRHQMLRHDVMRIDGVVYTHNHADHVFGIDDLRRFNAVMNEPLDIYAEPGVIEWMRHSFAYIFNLAGNVNKSFVPTLIPHPVEPGEAFELAGLPWLPMRLLHGKLPIVGYRVGDFAYCTDCSAIAAETWPLLADLDVLVIDALRYRHHPTHMTVEQALAVVEQLKPKRAYLTHIAHEIRHADLEANLPEHVMLGYDGLTIDVHREPHGSPFS
ncbi:MAG: MBL fold metallo-hydrolase [Phycisphaeraceae bacterium]